MARMRNVVITETELEIIHNVICDWFRLSNNIMPIEEYHRVLGLKHSLPECNKDMIYDVDI